LISSATSGNWLLLISKDAGTSPGALPAKVTDIGEGKPVKKSEGGRRKNRLLAEIRRRQSQNFT
jgi:hypothetical protein